VQAIKNDINLREQVVRTLLYFDIFSYPLKVNEVFNFLQINSIDESDVAGCLQSLAENDHIFRFGEYFGLQHEQKYVHRRIKGNEKAEEFLIIAKRKARFIARFPFVRAVMASGSLSKGYMDENSDLDFFIVTKPDRLWIARTLLVMYKRIFLFNSHKLFCVNYFVDTAHLEIEEKNLFTATELATLIPLVNYDCYSSLQNANSWLLDFFPNFQVRRNDTDGKMQSNFPRSMMEALLNPVAAVLDKFFMTVTLRRWVKIYGKDYPQKDFAIAFKTKRHVSKNHPRHYQKKILELYQLKLVQYQNRLDQIRKYE
jgi:hypothetical protein